MKYKTIRFASKAAYIGRTGSGSVKGYWTVWAQRVRWQSSNQEAGHWVPVGNPQPVNINQSLDDLYRSRGSFYDQDDLYHDGQLNKVVPRSCDDHGQEWMGSPEDSCYLCDGLWGYR